MPRNWKVAYAIVERAGKRHWLRVGIAFVNTDGSLNVRLDAMPVNGQLHIRDAPTERQEPIEHSESTDRQGADSR